MKNIQYPFAAIPNQIARGSHGAINLAVLTVILSHGDCWASIKTLAKEVKCGEMVTRNAIKYWIDYAEKCDWMTFEVDIRNGKTNKINVIFTRMDTPSQIATPCQTAATPPAKQLPLPPAKQQGKEEYIKNTIEEESITNVIEEKSTFGNEDINWVLEEFERIMKYSSQGRKQQDRFMAKHLLNNFSKEQISFMILYCATDSFAPRVGSIEKLWFKRGDIIAGIKKQQSKVPNMIIL